MASVCQDDFDCPAQFICFEGLNWQPENVSFCGCSSWYGWTGPECTDFNAQAKWGIAFNSIVAFIALLTALFGIRAMYVLFQYRAVNERFLNSTNTTSLLNMLSCISMFAWRLNALLIILAPLDNVRELSGDDEQKFPERTVIDRVFTALTATTATLTALNVSLVWLETAQLSAQVKRRVSSRFTVYKKVIVVFEVVFTVLLVVLVSLQQTDLATLATFPFLLFLIATFIVGNRRMKGVLASMTSEDDDGGASPDTDMSTAAQTGQPQSTVTGGRRNNYFKRKKAAANRYQELMRLISRTAVACAVCLTLIVIFGFLFAVLNLLDWRNFAEPGTVAWVTLMNEAFVAAILGAIVIIQLYLYENQTTKLKRLRETRGLGTSSRQLGTLNTSIDGGDVSKLGQSTAVQTYIRTDFKEAAASYLEPDDEQDVQNDEEV